MVSIQDVCKVNNCYFQLLMPFLSFFTGIHSIKIEKNCCFILFFALTQSKRRKIKKIPSTRARSIRKICLCIYYEINDTFSTLRLQMKRIFYNWIPINTWKKKKNKIQETSTYIMCEYSDDFCRNQRAKDNHKGGFDISEDKRNLFYIGSGSGTYSHM